MAKKACCVGKKIMRMEKVTHGPFGDHLDSCPCLHAPRNRLLICVLLFFFFFFLQLAARYTEKAWAIPAGVQRRREWPWKGAGALKSGRPRF